MSKVSIKLLLSLLALVFKFLRQAIRVVETIRDLADDGQLNGSADLPKWLDDVESALRKAVDVVSLMDCTYTDEVPVDDSDSNGHA